MHVDEIFREQDLIASVIGTLVGRAKETIVIVDGDIEAAGGPKIEFVNPAAEHLTGYAKTELIGERLSKIVLTERLPGVVAQLRKIRDTGQPFEIELHAKSVSGKEYWIDLSTIPIFAPDGTLRHFVRVGRDVTARKEAEQQRETVQRLLASVFGVIENSLLVANDAGIVIMANAALGRHLGWNVLDTIGKPVTMVLAEADRPVLEKLISTAETVDRSGKLAVRLARRSGVTVPGEVQLITIKLPDSQKYFIVKLWLK